MCRSRRELSNAYLLANVGFDTAENEPCKVCPIPQRVQQQVAHPPRRLRALGARAGPVVVLEGRRVPGEAARPGLPEVLRAAAEPQAANY